MPPQLPIYLDHNATTPVDPRVLDAMLPFFTQTFGNAASKNHIFGRDAAHAVEAAREQIAGVINARAQEIIFTSGATESINLAIKGLAAAAPKGKDHFITVATEHKAVLDCYSCLERQGFSTTVLPVDSGGMLDLADVQNAIRPETLLVSVMAANNEIGVIHDLAPIGTLCREHDAFFMTDATQAFGKEPLDVRRMNIDLLACSAHKVYGPKGVGALYVRRSNPRVKLQPIIDGGGHERGFRSGTLNVPGIVGFGMAAKLAVAEMASEQDRIREFRDQLQSDLLAAIPDSIVNGNQEYRLAGNLNISFPGVEAEALMIALKNDIAISSGSACASAAVEPSHVLAAIGCTEKQIHAAIRIGLGRATTDADVRQASRKTVDEACRLASLRKR